MTQVATEAALDLELQTQIDTTPDRAFAALLHQLGPGHQQMPMTLEARPGGRWFRDLGDEAGHLWAHVQVIKPGLLELAGPLFMSFPAINHMQFRVSENKANGGCTLTLKHTAIGLIPEDHTADIKQGWQQWLDATKQNAESA